jgi:hypothetical protein
MYDITYFTVNGTMETMIIRWSKAEDSNTPILEWLQLGIGRLQVE